MGVELAITSVIIWCSANELICHSMQVWDKDPYEVIRDKLFKFLSHVMNEQKSVYRSSD